jgi:hypothetical protein
MTQINKALNIVSFGFPITLPVYTSTFIYYRLFLLSSYRARQLCRIERLHPPGYSVTAAMLGTTIKDPHFVLTTVYEKFAFIRA